MTDHLEALIALAKSGTMAAAATRLRITPSAVSKRIALLEEQVGYKLAEPRGRKVELTPAALRLVEKVEPLLAELKSVLGDEAGVEAGEIAVGVTESVLASWGPNFLAKVSRQVPQLKLSIHAHRSPVIVDRVRSGEYSVGICAGVAERLDGLRAHVITQEPMVIVPSGLKKFSLRSHTVLEVISIESHALSWGSLRAQLKELREGRDLQLKVVREVESFSGVVQLAKSGFGHGFAPLGIALSLGVKREEMVTISSHPLTRSVSWVARGSTVARPGLRAFFEAMESSIVGFD